MLLAAPSTIPASVGGLIVADVPFAAVSAALALVVVIAAGVVIARRNSAPAPLGDTRPGVGDAELADFLVDSVPTSLQEATDLTRATPGAPVADEVPTAAPDRPIESTEPTD